MNTAKELLELLEMEQRFTDRYPKELVLDDGTQLTLTPMVPSDWQLLEQFLSQIPAADRLYLRHDMSDPLLVERWCAELDYQSTLPLLAWHGGRIVADATLHREPGLWTAHVGKMRLTVHSKYRGRGIGSRMIAELIDLARLLVLHKLAVECAAEQEDLILLLARRGFHEAARFSHFVRDRDGRLHDLVVMVYTLDRSEC